MTATPRVYEGSFYEQSRPTLLARVVDADGATIQQATTTSIAASIREWDDPSSELSSDVPVVADTVFDSLQTDDLWQEDETGYNFKYTVPLAKMTEADQFTYLIEVVFTTTTDIISVLYKLEQLAVASLS